MIEENSYKKSDVSFIKALYSGEIGAMIFFAVVPLFFGFWSMADVFTAAIIILFLIFFPLVIFLLCKIIIVLLKYLNRARGNKK